MCLYTIEATDYCIKCFDYLQKLQSTSGSTPVVYLVMKRCLVDLLRKRSNFTTQNLKVVGVHGGVSLDVTVEKGCCRSF